MRIKKSKYEMMAFIEGIMEEMNLTNVRTDGAYVAADEGIINVYDDEAWNDLWYDSVSTRDAKRVFKKRIASIIKESNESIASDLRACILANSENIKMTALLADLKIDRNNYNKWIKGANTLSNEKAESILDALIDKNKRRTYYKEESQ